MSFNENQHAVDTASAIIGLDEGFKRYSYGPPVLAAEELLILIEAGLVSLCIVGDPAIALKAGGWQLIEADDVMSASVMVDAVIAGTALSGVRDPLVAACRDAGLLTSFATELGALTSPDGQLIDATGKAVPGHSMLGRLALGSVIAVDGLSDCFGPSATCWARGVVRRLA